MLAGGLIGVAFGIFLSSNWALATDLVPKGKEARSLGLANVATAGGAALARLVGPVIDLFNSLGPNLGYSVMLLICFLAFISGAWLLARKGTHPFKQYSPTPGTS
jgi:MFS family permease